MNASNSVIDRLFSVFINNIDAGIWKAKEIYEQELLNELKRLLATPSLENIFQLSVILKFWPALMQESRIKKCDLVIKNKKSIKDEKFINKKEIKKIADDLLNDFHDGDSKFKSTISNYSTHVTHEQCLILAKQNNIRLDEKIIRKIKLENFGLEWDLGETGKERGVTLNENGAVEFLSYEMGTSVSVKNLYELNLLSLPYTFGVYIDKSYFEITEEHIVPSRSIDEIYNAINRNIVCRDYSYDFDGLVRLLTKYEIDPDDECRNKQTVKNIRDGGEIKIGINYPFLWFQPSLAQYILGVGTYCKIGKNHEEINNSNFRFRKEELAEFARINKQDLEEMLCCRKNDALQVDREKKLTRTIQKIIDVARDNNIPIVKTELPGTKKEFISLIKSVDKSFLAFSDSTISDYFLRIGVKFKPGTKTGKCETYQKVEKAILDSIAVK